MSTRALRGCRRVASAMLATLLVAALTACGGSDGSATPTVAPTVASTASPITTASATTEANSTDAPATTGVTTAPPTTDHAHSVPATSAPVVTLSDGNGMSPAVALPAACEPRWSDRIGDEITFARGRDLFTYRPATGEVACLAALAREPQQLSWSPDGTTLLVDADLLVDATGSRPSGFAAGTPGISWSKPNGTALIAPSADGSELVHIDIDDPRSATDVGGLATTWVAGYHPSGEAIVSAGVDAAGRRGLFLTDNRGGQLTQLVTLDDPDDTITEVSFNHDGSWVNFVHDHAGADDGVAAHVHRFDLIGVFVTDLVTLPDAVPFHVVTSRQIDDSVGYSVSYSTVSSFAAFVTGPGTVIPVRVGEEHVEPIGFLDEGDFVTIGRGVPERTGPGMLRLVSPGGGVTVLAGDVTAAATRVAPFPTWQEPPVGVILQAVG